MKQTIAFLFLIIMMASANGAADTDSVALRGLSNRKNNKETDNDNNKFLNTNRGLQKRLLDHNSVVRLEETIWGQLKAAGENTLLFADPTGDNNHEFILQYGNCGNCYHIRHRARSNQYMTLLPSGYVGLASSDNGVGGDSWVFEPMEEVLRSIIRRNTDGRCIVGTINGYDAQPIVTNGFFCSQFNIHFVGKADPFQDDNISATIDNLGTGLQLYSSTALDDDARVRTGVEQDDRWSLNLLSESDVDGSKYELVSQNSGRILGCNEYYAIFAETREHAEAWYYASGDLALRLQWILEERHDCPPDSGRAGATCAKLVCAAFDEMALTDDVPNHPYMTALQPKSSHRNQLWAIEA